MASSTIALFNCLLLISFIFSSIAASIPDSEWPFEFNNEKGSKITENNILTQQVSSNGKNVLSTTDSQPIKIYHSSNKNNNNNKKTKVQSAANPISEETYVYKQNPHKTKQSNNEIASNKYGSPIGNSHISHMTTYDNNEWSLLDNFSKFFPGMSNIKVVYI